MPLRKLLIAIMAYNPNIHRRCSIRLKDYDYSQAGLYFVTICTKRKQCFFGDIKNDKMYYNSLGAIAYNYWRRIPQHFPHVNLDVFVIMPNHVHGILWLTKSPNIETNTHQFRKVTKGSISSIIRCYKAAVTKEINQMCQQKGTSLIWQRNFYEHIIRDENSLHNIRQYILNNPKNWENDDNYSSSTDLLLDLPF